MSRGSPNPAMKLATRQNRPADFTATFIRLIDLDEVRVWRMSRRARLLCAAMVTAMLALTAYAGLWAAANGGGASFALLGVFVVIDVVVLRMARYSFGSITTASPDGVRIGRGRRAVVVPWQAIDVCKAGDRGTTIDCSDGRRVLAPAPQHSNVKRGQHRKTEADYAALYITERARMFRLANPAPALASDLLDDAVADVAANPGPLEEREAAADD